MIRLAFDLLDILVQGTAEGDIVLTAETGDIIISGNIIIDSDQATLRQHVGKS